MQTTNPDATTIVFELHVERVADCSPKFHRLRFAINRAPREGDPEMRFFLPDNVKHGDGCSCAPCGTVRGVNASGSLGLMRDLVDSAAFRDEFASWVMRAARDSLARA